MAQNDKIQLFENKRIRTAWDEEKEEWYFSIVDVVAVLTDQPDQRHAAKYIQQHPAQDTAQQSQYYRARQHRPEQHTAAHQSGEQ